MAIQFQRDFHITCMSLWDNITCVVGKNSEGEKNKIKERARGFQSPLWYPTIVPMNSEGLGKTPKQNIFHDFLQDHIFPQGGQEKNNLEGHLRV